MEPTSPAPATRNGPALRSRRVAWHSSPKRSIAASLPISTRMPLGSRRMSPDGRVSSLPPTHWAITETPVRWPMPASARVCPTSELAGARRTSATRSRALSCCAPATVGLTCREARAASAAPRMWRGV